MNTQMERLRAHGAPHDQDDPLHGTLGLRPAGVEGHHEEMEHDGEKKSVLKKVKAKARKIKDAVTGHHGNHDHDDDDEEMETDPEVHGLPTVPRPLAPGLDEVARPHGTNPRGERTNIQVSSHLPTSQPAHFEPFDPTSTNYIPIQQETFGHSEIDTRRPMPTSKPGDDYQTFDPSTTRYVPGQEETLGHSRTDIGGPMGSEERPYAPRSTPVGAHDSGVSRGSAGLGVPSRGASEEIGGVLERPLDLEEDPHAPKDGGKGGHFPENYQAKVIDPSGRGAEEIGVTPILHRLDRMKIDDKDERPKEEPSTGQEESLFKPSLDQEKATHSTEPPTDLKPLLSGTHDQFSPEPLIPETTPLLGTPESIDTTQSVSPEPQDKTSEQKKEMSYTEKVTSAATVLSDKAKQATTIVTSRLSEYTGGTHEGSILQKVEEKVHPILQKVGEVGSTVASKVQSSSPQGGTSEPELEVAVDKGVSVRDYFAEKLKPGEDDRALSELITENLPLHKQREGTNEVSNEDSGSSSPGKGVLDKIKDAASSLFGKGVESEIQPSSEVFSDDSTTGY